MSEEDWKVEAEKLEIALHHAIAQIDDAMEHLEAAEARFEMARKLSRDALGFFRNFKRINRVLKVNQQQ